jgi:5-deoxy-glucuronate isomerase
MSPLLVKAARDGRDIVAVTPESAGWSYVGFQALRLRADDTHAIDTATREHCIVVLRGTVDIAIDGGPSFDALGTRDSVFDPVSPAAVYVPPGHRVTIRARRDSEVALCSAPCESRQDRAPKLLDSSTMRRSARGKGSNTRFICDVLPHDDPTAEHLLVVEVLTPAGHSSSYPPHKHDSESPPTETQLEETYYHRLNPPQGFAFQRVYTDDRSLDEACAVEDHDVVMVPRGYHPVVAPHGYDLYYLNVMAGPNRFWVFKNDPAHEWIVQQAAAGKP